MARLPLQRRPALNFEEENASQSYLGSGADLTQLPSLEQEWPENSPQQAFSNATFLHLKHHGLRHPTRNHLCTVTTEFFTCRVPSLSLLLKAPFFHAPRSVSLSLSHEDDQPPTSPSEHLHPVSRIKIGCAHGHPQPVHPWPAQQEAQHPAKVSWAFPQGWSLAPSATLARPLRRHKGNGRENQEQGPTHISRAKGAPRWAPRSVSTSEG